MIRRPLENSRDWICRTVNRITETVIAKILSPGERTQVRASVKHKLNFRISCSRNAGSPPPPSIAKPANEPGLHHLG
jgi:hypothetical protein